MQRIVSWQIIFEKEEMAQAIQTHQTISNPSNACANFGRK
jgi:hypothetical protein